MSKLAMHVEHYKRGSIGAIDQHNLRTGETHGNEDIDPERSEENIQLLTPEGGSLYAEVKAAADQAKGRVTANSVLVTEWIVYPPENLQNPYTADRDNLKAWGEDVLAWMKEKDLHPKAATIHLDETTAHMHIDTMPFTKDGRLSRKEIYTRKALSEYHTELAEYLAKKGWDIQRGDVRKKGEKGKSKTVREYKAWAEEEKARLEKELSAAKANAQEQIEAANKEAERAQAYIGQLSEFTAKQQQTYEENRQILKNLDNDIRETEEWLLSDPDFTRQVARTAELRRLREAEKTAAEKLKRQAEQLKAQAKMLECLREDLRARVEDYVDLKEKKKEAWANRSEAEQTVAVLQSILEDSGKVQGILVRMALCGAEAQAKKAREKHDALCAAVRAQKHKLKSEQRQLLRQSQELDQLIKDGADDAGRQSQKRKDDLQR